MTEHSAKEEATARRRSEAARRGWETKRARARADAERREAERRVAKAECLARRAEEVEAALRRHRAYLAAIEQAAPTDEVRDLLTLGYHLWLFNRQIKAVPAGQRFALYALKRRTVRTILSYYALDAQAQGTPVVYRQVTPEGAQEIADSLGLPRQELPGAVCVMLGNTGLGAGACPQPAVFLEHVIAQGDYDDYYDLQHGGRVPRSIERHHLSFVLVYAGFRFRFHTPWDRCWFPKPLRAALQPGRPWTADSQPFTFGGGVATHAERAALSLESLRAWLEARVDALRAGRP
jgi:hypothetical protein